MTKINSTPEWQEFKLMENTVSAIETRLNSYQKSLLAATERLKSVRVIAYQVCADAGHAYDAQETLEDVLLGTKFDFKNVRRPDNTDPENTFGNANSPTYDAVETVVPVYEKHFVKTCLLCGHKETRKAKVTYE